MKRVYLIAVLTVIGLTAIAQENQNEYRAIFNKKSDQKISHGGYGAFGVGYSMIDDKDAILFHFKTAWIIDHKVGIGFAGSGFFNNLDKNFSDTEHYLAGGYGGFMIEPVLFSNWPVHLTFPLIMGAGGVSTIPKNYWDWDWDPVYSYQYDYDVFFYIEPGVEVELNMVKFFRMSVGASYRFTNGILIEHPDYGPVAKDTMDGFNFHMYFKFGKF